jgi:putative copper export protein
MNLLIHGLITFTDLTALSSVVGTVLCLFWTVCPVCDDAPTNPCFDRCSRMLFFCLIGLSVSSIASLVRRSMEMAGLGIAEIAPALPTVLFGTHYGSMWLIRAASVFIAWCVWGLGKRHLNSRIVTFLLLLACAAIAFSRSASSHAADQGDFSLQELSDWFHLLAAASWGGALMSISLMLSVSDVEGSSEQQHIVSDIAYRFYGLFGPVFAVLVSTGLYNTWVEVGSFGVLLTTPYGRILSVKLLIFAYLTSRYIAPPQRRKDEAAYAIKFLKRTRVDAFLIMAILFCVALFTQEVPARHAAHMMMEHENKMYSTHGMDTDHAISYPTGQSQEQSPVKMTDHGLYSVKIVMKDKNMKVGVNTFDIILRDKTDKDVGGAEITVVPWMPEMGHGVFEKPIVKERGGGTYSVENVILIMEGSWVLRLKIKKNNEEDNVTFGIHVAG